MKKTLETYSSFLLAGHFCIFNKSCDIELLPEFVYKEMPISKILLLETTVQRVIDNIKERDSKTYSVEAIQSLISAERAQAEKISTEFKIPLYIHEMQFTQNDIDEVSNIIQRRIS